MKNLICFLLCSLFTFVVQAKEIVWNVEEPFTTENIASKLGREEITIVIANTLLIENTVEVPSNITLRFEEKGMLKIVNEQSFLLVQEPILARAAQIFDLSGRGVLTYDGSSISNITLLGNTLYYPEWWGLLPNVVPSYVNDSEKANTRHYIVGKEMMLDVAASGGGEIHFSKGVYYIRDLVIDFDDITISGEGRETILRSDRKNFGTSTRRGGLFTIQGPTIEKFYHKIYPEGRYQTGNFTFNKIQKTIENIIVRNLSIEWNEASALEDPAMNGLTIVNAKNVLIDNVHVDLKGANRAFYIGTLFEGDVTKNITIQNSSCIASRTGVLILHGFDNLSVIRTKMILDSIVIKNNNFEVVGLKSTDQVNNVQLNIDWLDRYGSGVLFGGSEFTKTFEVKGDTINRKLGSVLIENNVVKDADFGVRAYYSNNNEYKGYEHKVTIQNNRFINFKHVGVLAPFTTCIIKDNVFKISELIPVEGNILEADKMGYMATAIHIAKAPWKFFKSNHGPEDVVIEGNTFDGCFQQNSPLIIQPNKDATLQILNNNFKYDLTCTKPQHDIVVTTNRRKFRTKKATIVLANNIEDSSNQSSEEASVLLDVRRKKHITIIESEQE